MVEHLPQIVLSASSTVIFTVFAWGVRGHFRSRHLPRGMIVVSVVSGIAFVLMEIETWRSPAPMPWVAVGLSFYLASLVLFLAAVRATNAQRLTLAFDRDLPTFLVATGPYRHIRHPFYASYLLYWFGGATGTQAPACIVMAVIMLVIYVIAARTEEAKFEASSLREDYRRYCLHAGFLWPKHLVGQ